MGDADYCARIALTSPRVRRSEFACCSRKFRVGGRSTSLSLWKGTFALRESALVERPLTRPSPRKRGEGEEAPCLQGGAGRWEGRVKSRRTLLTRRLSPR